MLARSFIVASSLPNQLELSWTQPIDLNNSTNELIITRSNSHYPVELYNTVFPTKATDPRPIEIFRGATIAGLGVGTISVATNILTDTAATFPTNPPLKGRLVRDSIGNLFKITANTTTTLTLDGNPTNGKYVVLADFPQTIRASQTLENDIRTEVGVGFIKNVVSLIDGNALINSFAVDELANLFFVDASGSKFLIKSNTADTIYFYETTLTPNKSGVMFILSSSTNNITKTYVDNFLNTIEAAARTGTGLENNQFYYYTVFTKPLNANVAQAVYGSIDSSEPTQASGLSVEDKDFGGLLYSYWPGIYKELDATGDLEDLMQVFGFQFSELYALIKTFKLQDPHSVYATALSPFAEQTGLPTVKNTIGADTLRRIAQNMLGAWRLKGSKEGIALFIKIITTWDITDGTGDFGGSIIDVAPNISAFHFFDAALGITNIRFTNSSPFVAGGRFVKSLPGIIIPGFFSYREFIIDIPNVALFLGTSTNITTSAGNTIITDFSAMFGGTNNLVGNYVLPNQEEVDDLYKIVANTPTSVTVEGLINNTTIGGNYVILSPLNANRFSILNKLLGLYIPFKTKAGFNFI